MEIKSEIKGNYLTRKIGEDAIGSTFLAITLLIIGFYLYHSGIFNARELMPASAGKVFKEQEYWRLWSTLFAHADLEHLFSNLLLFLPFAYFLSGHFGFFYFPLFGFLVGGVTNFFVLKTMPDPVFLIGVSGVLYWMGATWLTLALLIDRWETFGRRLMKAIGISLVLFFPHVYRPEVSYLSHSIGYLLGVVCGVGYYFIFYKRIKAAEVVEQTIVPEVDFDWKGEENSVQE